ncbi:FAD-binding dehydrogenase [Georgenia deserti]|uniref:FAD-binding dehydrogenase n=1 Tax=Georgenia deserti TaxID=2093781 RepID=A0ABW4L901_9MICO
MPRHDADVIVVGTGLAGLVATAELADAGRRVVLLDQENLANLGGQAWWSFGGLFLVDSPEQHRLRVRDSLDLAWQDWLGTAGFDREREDTWPRRWARAYVEFAAEEKRAWLDRLGVRFFPVVGWAERGGQGASGPGNSVPRFHIVWGTGPALLEPFVRRVRAAVDQGLVRLAMRHRVDRLLVTDGVVDGVGGSVLTPSDTPRGVASSREVTGDFELRAGAVVLTSGGIGGNHGLVREYWPDRLGRPPEDMLTGVPAYVDGSVLTAVEAAGASLINRDRMWHYTEGIANHSPVWPGHGIRILPGPSSLWLDAAGRRLPAPNYPGFDTLGTLRHLRRAQTGHEGDSTGTVGAHSHSWFVLTQRIAEKELALSGSEQNPDLTGKDLRLLSQRLRPGAPGPVRRFLDDGEDFVVADTLAELVEGMNALTPHAPVEFAQVEGEVLARDREMANAFSKDPQITALRGARNYLGDKLIRVAPPHRLLDPAAGPLIAIRLRTLTRKTLGGLETDLDGQVLRPDGEPLPGLFAAGEVAGFGGGGMHGYASLEGTFLGGCLFSGRRAGRGAAS